MEEQNTGGEWFEIESSNLDQAKWDEETGQMQVKFKSGKTYHYEGVTGDEWEAFKATFGSGASKHFSVTFRHWGKEFGVVEVE